MRNDNLAGNLISSIIFNLKGQRLSYFLPLIQTGVQIEAEFGIPVKSFLLTLPGVDETYIKERIKTVFMDGEVLDDLETAHLSNGVELTLSASMPGLAGATLRMGGHLATLRKEITFSGEKEKGATGQGFVTLKLFNLIIKDLGQGLLENGIYIKHNQFENLIKGSEFAADLEDITLNDQEMTLQELSGMNWADPGSMIEIRVAFSS